MAQKSLIFGIYEQRLYIIWKEEDGGTTKVYMKQEKSTIGTREKLELGARKKQLYVGAPSTIENTQMTRLCLTRTFEDDWQIWDSRQQTLDVVCHDSEYS